MDSRTKAGWMALAYFLAIPVFAAAVYFEVRPEQRRGTMMVAGIILGIGLLASLVMVVLKLTGHFPPKKD